MTQFASLSGARVATGRITIPVYGMWIADVVLSAENAVSERVSLTIGNLTLAGAIVRQSVFAGSRACRLVAGGGGWRREIPSAQYRNPRGIPLAMPLSDAASSVGERVVAPSTSLGNSYIRQAGPASNVLRDLGGPTWHIDASGTVQLTPWPSKRVGTPFTAIEQDGGAGIVEIATEDYASWLPGCTFTLPTLDGVYTNRGVVFTFDDDGTLRLEVLTQ